MPHDPRARQRLKAARPAAIAVVGVLAAALALTGPAALVEVLGHHLPVQVQHVAKMLAATVAAAVAIAAGRAVWRLESGRARRQALAVAALAALATTLAAWSHGVRQLPSTDYNLGMGPVADFVTGTPARHVHINRQGLRDVDRPDRPALRVLLVGDSCVFGQGVAFADTLGQQLEARLRALLHVEVEVYNLGISGNNLVSATEIGERMAGEVGADVILVAYLREAMRAPFDMAWRRRAVARVGPYRIASALFGENEASAFAALVERTTLTEESQRIVPQGAARLKILAEQSRARLQAFCYSPCADLQATGLAPLVFADFRQRPGLTFADGHPTPAGNAWLADQLAPRVAPLLQGRPLRPRQHAQWPAQESTVR